MKTLADLLREKTPEMKRLQAENRALLNAYLDRYAEINGFRRGESRPLNGNEIAVEVGDGDAWEANKQQRSDNYAGYCELAG